MPELAPDRLHDLGRRVFEAAGAPADVADHVAGHLVASNLAGHDSHGVLRIPWYLVHIRRGWLRPAARPRGVEGRPAAGRASGGGGFGRPAATVASDTTTAVAGGKVMVARDKGVPLPEGVVLDRDGRPTTDPAAALDGGWLLPFGAHKGYALAFFAQLLGQALTGADALAGETDADSPFARAGAFFVAIDPGLFRPAADAAASADGFAAAVRDLPPA